MASKKNTHEGGCTCGHVRYRMASNPLIVHCCHCRYCQQQSGASFAVNALIETDRVERLGAAIDEVLTDTPSGAGQIISRCPKCRVAVWSNYLSMGKQVRFIRVGTLDDPDQLPPDVHIYTSTKQPWVVIPRKHRTAVEFYEMEKTWSKASLKRRDVMLASRDKS